MDIHEVRVPGPCTNWGAMGYTNSMKSRASHAKFDRWLFEHVYIMCVNDLEAFYNFPINTATACRSIATILKLDASKMTQYYRDFFKT